MVDLEKQHSHVESLDHERSYDVDACIRAQFDIKNAHVFIGLVDTFHTRKDGEELGDFERTYIDPAFPKLEERALLTVPYTADSDRISHAFEHARTILAPQGADALCDAAREWSEKKKQVGTTLLEWAKSIGKSTQVTSEYVAQTFADPERMAMIEADDIRYHFGSRGWHIYHDLQGAYICLVQENEQVHAVPIDALASNNPEKLKENLSEYYVADAIERALRDAAFDVVVHETGISEYIPAYLQQMANERPSDAIADLKSIINVLQWSHWMSTSKHEQSRSWQWDHQLGDMQIPLQWKIKREDFSQTYWIGSLLNHLADCDGTGASDKQQARDIRQLFNHLRSERYDHTAVKPRWITEELLDLYKRPKVPSKEDIQRVHEEKRLSDTMVKLLSTWKDGRQPWHTQNEFTSLIREIHKSYAEALDTFKESVNTRRHHSFENFDSIMESVWHRISRSYGTPLSLSNAREAIGNEFKMHLIDDLSQSKVYETQSSGITNAELRDILLVVSIERAREDALGRQKKDSFMKDFYDRQLKDLDTLLGAVLSDWQKRADNAMGIIQKVKDSIAERKKMYRSLGIGEKELALLCQQESPDNSHAPWHMLQLLSLAKMGKVDLQKPAVVSFLQSFYPWMTDRQISWLGTVSKQSGKFALKTPYFLLYGRSTLRH